MESDNPNGKAEMNQVEYNLMYQLLIGWRRYVGSGAFHGMPLSWLSFLGAITRRSKFL